MKRLYPDADGLTDICEIYHDVAQKVRPDRIGSHCGEVHITQIKSTGTVRTVKMKTR